MLQLPPSNRAVLAKLAELCREISLLASTDALATAQTLAVLIGEATLAGAAKASCWADQFL